SGASSAGTARSAGRATTSRPMPSEFNRSCSSAALWALADATTRRPVTGSTTDGSGCGSLGQVLALEGVDATDAAFGQAEQRVELVAAERRAFGGGLHLYEQALAGHDHVHVGLGGRVLCVREVEHRDTVHHTDGDRGQLVVERHLGEQA